VTEFGVSSGVWQAQSFTAGLTGDLDQVDLLLWKDATTTAPLKVEIRTLSGGVPSTTVLASAFVPATSVPTGRPAQAFVSVPLSPPAPSVAGTQYVIVCRPPWLLSTLGWRQLPAAPTMRVGSFSAPSMAG
jgi:hypothetical protein